MTTQLFNVVKASTEKHNRRCNKAIIRGNGAMFMNQYTRAMTRWADWWISKGHLSRGK